MNKKEKHTFYDLYKKVRNDWGVINPVTKIKENKKKYSRKEKHKGKDYGIN